MTPFDASWSVLKRSTLPIGPIDHPYWYTFGRTERQLGVPPGRARNQREQLMREPRVQGDEMEPPEDTRVLGERGYWGKNLGELQRDQEEVDWWNQTGRYGPTKYRDSTFVSNPFGRTVQTPTPKGKGRRVPFTQFRAEPMPKKESVLPPSEEVNQSLKEAADAWAKKQFEDASYGEKLRMFDEDTARQTSATPSVIWEDMLAELKRPGTQPLGTSLSRLTTPNNLEQIGDSNLL